MANDKVLPEGIRVFDKHQNAPDFVVASVVITPEDLVAFVKANPDYLSDYQGKKQLRLQLLKSQAGKLYMTVDTYKRQEQAKESYSSSEGYKTDDGSGLPF